MEKHADGLTSLSLAKGFAASTTVNHSANEYYCYKDAAGVQSAESFFALLKRQIFGIHHAVSEAHLQRYVTEAAFRWNHRIALGVDDTGRAKAALKCIGGKRLTYGTTRAAQDA
jgi:hypothetical protein